MLREYAAPGSHRAGRAQLEHSREDTSCLQRSSTGRFDLRYNLGCSAVKDVIEPRRTVLSFRRTFAEAILAEVNFPPLSPP